MIYNQTVTWTAFAILAMFFTALEMETVCKPGAGTMMKNESFADQQPLERAKENQTVRSARVISKTRGLLQ